ncbi:hypothetical protein, partial [Klebsiella pneumoniae]|uniref:hypothetical protein n=1 Tax=Klebsiella pneumoniae TaxID=573 RepID=UPI001C640F5D
SSTNIQSIIARTGQLNSSGFKFTAKSLSEIAQNNEFLHYDNGSLIYNGPAHHIMTDEDVARLLEES